MYPRIHQKIFNEPWAITPSAYDAIRETFCAHLAGKASGHSRIEALSGLPDSESAKPPRGSGAVAIIGLNGIIGKRLDWLETMCGGCDLDAVRYDFEAALASSQISTLILWGDTPGGTVTGVPEFAQMVYRASQDSGKQILGYSDTQCCSAGYWILSQCQEFFAAPSAAVGSIGAVITLLDQSQADAQEGLTYTTLKSGPYKDLGNPHRAATDDELALLQSRVDTAANEFFAAVQATRPDVDAVGLGARVLTGPEALSANLIDGNYDTLEDLLGDL